MRGQLWRNPPRILSRSVPLTPQSHIGHRGYRLATAHRLASQLHKVPRHECPNYDGAMIDFSNGSVFKLNPCSEGDIAPAIAPLIIPGERIVSCFKAVRDFVVFTDKRLIAVNVQGMTGKKRDFTSLPYSKIQAFSIETAGTFDRDAELDLWFSGLGKVRLEFKGNSDIRQLGHMIATFVL
jgi:hypothetical protein